MGMTYFFGFLDFSSEALLQVGVYRYLPNEPSEYRRHCFMATKEDPTSDWLSGTGVYQSVVEDAPDIC